MIITSPVISNFNLWVPKKIKKRVSSKISKKQRKIQIKPKQKSIKKTPKKLQTKQKKSIEIPVPPPSFEELQIKPPSIPKEKTFRTVPNAEEFLRRQGYKTPKVKIDDVLLEDKKITLKGPGGELITLKYETWFPKGLSYIPLYVGKTTKLKSRISQHLLQNKFPGRVHAKPENHRKVKPKTTSCQLRAGIEHIFPNERNPRDFIFNNVGLSYLGVQGKESTSKRFYLENFAIGYLKPWFNLDSER